MLSILNSIKNIEDDEKKGGKMWSWRHFSDREIADYLSQDIDYIRVCLKTMKSLSLITTRKGGDEPNSLMVKEITSNNLILAMVTI